MPSSLIEAILGTGDKDITGDEFLSKPPHKDETINHGNGITQVFRDGGERWYQFGKLHRDGDLPAVTEPGNYQAWYQHGLLHRDDDKPAVVYADGTQQWYQHGLRHRDGDKPARIYPNGRVDYWVNGEKVK